TVISSSILLPIFTFGIFGNVLLISTIHKHKKFHTPSYILSVNMAISDIIQLLFGTTYLVLNVILIYGFSLNTASYKAICQIHFSVLSSSFTTSSQSLLAVSIDRYLTINTVNNSKSPFTRRKVLILTIIYTWLIGFTLAIPVAFVVDINPAFPFLCDLRSNGMDRNQLIPIIRFITAIISYPVPLLTASFLYQKVIKRIRSSIVAHNELKNKVCVWKNHSRQVDATKMMIIATVIFMIIALPMFIVLVLFSTTQTSVTELVLEGGLVPYILITGSFLLAMINSVQNPLVFFVYNKTFRKAI
ncbi:uncharacterized protein TRIADDRAFT_3838, partial [Trichoplax adhaerens]